MSPQRIALVVAGAILVVGCTGGDATDEPAAGATATDVTPDEPAGPTTTVGPFATIPAPTLPDGLGPVIERATGAADAADEALGAGDVGFEERRDAREDAAEEVLVEAQVTLLRRRSPVGVTIVPDRDGAGCDVAALTDAYGDSATGRRALVAAQRIDDGAIGDYLDELRAGFLIDEATVIAYDVTPPPPPDSTETADDSAEGATSPETADGDGDGEAADGDGDVADGEHEGGTAGSSPVAEEVTLEAGAAVLVDADGVPRMECATGRPIHPLVWPLDGLDGRLVPLSAFADEIASAGIGADVPSDVSDTVDGRFTDRPEAALGPPDRVAVSLGDGPGNDPESCRNQVTVVFSDNRLIDGPGPDLYVVELGRSESVLVSVGIDGDALQPVGEVSGDDPTLDLAGAVAPDGELAVVRLCDGPDGSSDVPGSDIDAVVALNSTPRDEPPG